MDRDLGPHPQDAYYPLPLPGVVTMKLAEEESYIKAGTTTYRITDLSRVRVEVRIYDYELAWVALGRRRK